MSWRCPPPRCGAACEQVSLQDDVVVDDGVAPLLVVRVERGGEAIDAASLKRCSLALAVTSAVLNDEAVSSRPCARQREIGEAADQRNLARVDGEDGGARGRGDDAHGVGGEARERQEHAPTHPRLRGASCTTKVVTVHTTALLKELHITNRARLHVEVPPNLSTALSAGMKIVNWWTGR